MNRSQYHMFFWPMFLLHGYAISIQAAAVVESWYVSWGYLQVLCIVGYCVLTWHRLGDARGLNKWLAFGMVIPLANLVLVILAMTVPSKEVA